MKRGEITALVRPMLAKVAVGGFAAITLPPKEPMRRIVYQRISAVAGQVWGVGTFSLEARREPERVIVRRHVASEQLKRESNPVLMSQRDREALTAHAINALMEYQSP